MADDRNVVEILVTSRNKTRAGFKEAEVEAEVTANRIAAIFRRMHERVGTSLATMGSNIGGNLGKGGGLFALGSGALAMAGPLAAAGAAVGAFGAVAIPVLTKIAAAHTALAAAQQRFANATTGKQRIAALKAEEQATAGLTSGEKGLMGTVAQLGKMWSNLEGQMAPVVVDVVKVALSLAKDLMPAFKALASVGGNALETILGYLGQFVRTPFFAQFIRQMSQMASQIAPLLGQTLVGLLKLFAQLLMAVMPAGVQILNILLPLIIQLATDLVPVIAYVAQLIAGLLQWLQTTHLLLPVLALVAIAILAMEAPVWAVIAAVAVLIAIGVELSKHWGQIWGFMHRVIMDVWNWIRDHWRLLLPILLGPVGLAVDFITAHWRTISRVLGEVIDWIRSHWRLVVEILLGPVGFAVVWIVDHWHQLMHALGEVVDFIRREWSAVYGILVGPIEQAWHVISPILGAIGGAIGAIGGGISSVGNFLGLASGGIVGAAGGGVHGGWRLVGEHGPELARLPGGSHVFSNSQSRGLLGGGSGRAEIVIRLEGGDDPILRGLRNAIRIRGGNVQAVLGQGSF